MDVLKLEVRGSKTVEIASSSLGHGTLKLQINVLCGYIKLQFSQVSNQSLYSTKEKYSYLVYVFTTPKGQRSSFHFL